MDAQVGSDDKPVAAQRSACVGPGCWVQGLRTVGSHGACETSDETGLAAVRSEVPSLTFSRLPPSPKSSHL